VALAGLHVDQVDNAGAVAAVEGFFADGAKHRIVTVNTDFMRKARRDGEYRDVLNSADLAVADGMPLVWLSRLQRTPLPERVAGIELVEAICGAASRAGIGVFLLGAAPGIADAAGRALVARHPGLRIAGVYSPPFGPHTPEEDARMVAAIRAAGRCAVLVAFGAPRQDRFIHRHLMELDIAVGMGVGCAFDVLAGAVRRAPQWMQRSGLEWLWRLGQEPGRLWRRYLVEDAPLLGALAVSAVRSRLAAGQARR
jgi:N-acetylglucosaminyldiphosphoundecaprenol N-acetyl-beta-D-mannosaminyltransferase